MLRYLRGLSDKDLALDRSMIPLGSCTMKLNATSEMIPITWPEFAHIASVRARRAARRLRRCSARSSSDGCAQATGYAGVSLQPNAGSQGEYAGLLVIRAWHASRGEARARRLPDPRIGARHQPGERAAWPGCRSSSSSCDADGNVDLADLRAKCAAARGAARRGDDHLPLDLRRVRGAA